MMDFASGKLFIKVLLISLGLNNNLKHSYFFQHTVNSIISSQQQETETFLFHFIISQSDPQSSSRIPIKQMAFILINMLSSIFLLLSKRFKQTKLPYYC